MDKYKKSYYELQVELDKIDCMRKNWTYFALKREKFVKSITTQQPREEEEDLGCDCQSREETPVFRSPLYRW